MKKLKLFMCVALFGAMSFGAFSAYNHLTMSAEKKALLENIEALTSGENPGGGWDCDYLRYPSMCRIYVGVKGSVKLFGGTVIKADADGYAKFDGQLTCGSGGNLTCTPIECRELYESILN